MTGRVIIVGAGILGAATALSLLELGVRDITLLDRSVPGAGATGRSGALVRANCDHETEARLALHSLDVYRHFAEVTRGGGSGFQESGLLVTVPPHLAEATLDLARRQRSWGVAIDEIQPEAARMLAPLLRTDDVGPILYQASAGYCDPNVTLCSYIDELARSDVRLGFDTPVTRVLMVNGRARGVETAYGNLEADVVVVAAGIWTNPLLPDGLDYGLVPHLSRVAVFRPYEPGLSAMHPAIIDSVQDAWFRPMPEASILVGSESGGLTGIDPETVPTTAPTALVERYRDILTRRLAVNRGAAIRGSWAGAFMLSGDRRPLVGAVPGYAGLYLAGGDSGGSFKIAPALGLALAEDIVFGAPCSFNMDALSPARALRRTTSDQAFRPSATISR